MSFKSKAKSGVTSRGWPPERRRKQAERLRKLKPWLKSTGPKTRTGKARAAQNALKHGGRARLIRKIAYMLALHRRLLRKINENLCSPSSPVMSSAVETSHKISGDLSTSVEVTCFYSAVISRKARRSWNIFPTNQPNHDFPLHSSPNPLFYRLL